MREIKFRAWDKKKKVMGKSFELLDAAYEGFPRPITDDNGEYDHRAEFEVMQFTGLKDKNGKEIYEGDVVSNSSYKPGDAVEVIKFKNGAFYGESGAEAHLFYNVGYYNNEAQVIGNIYENKDLLK